LAWSINVRRQPRQDCSQTRSFSGDCMKCGEDERLVKDDPDVSQALPWHNFVAPIIS